MSELSELFHHRWAVPLLAALQKEKDLTYAAVSSALKLSRGAFNDTLAALNEQGLLDAQKKLTKKGEKVAERAHALLAAAEKQGEVAWRKWSMPIVHALAKKPARFGQLKEALKGVTPRALSMAMKELLDAGLVERKVVDGFPPRAEYTLGPKAKALAPVLEQLAKL